MGKTVQRNRKIEIAIFLLLTLLIIIIFIYQVSQFKYLPFISYHHLGTTQEIINSENMIKNNIEYSHALFFNYAPNSYLINAILSIITGLDLNLLYVIFPIVMLIITIAFLHSSSNMINSKYKITLLPTILSTSVLATFFILNYPQTLSIMFLSSILFVTFRKSNNKFLLFGIFLGAAITTHLTPSLFGILLICSIIFISSESIKAKLKNLSLVFIGLIFFILLYPLKLIINNILFIKNTTEEKLAMEWVGNQLAWVPNYEISHYIFFIIGPALLLFLTLSFIYTLKSLLKRKETIIFIIAFLTILLALITQRLFYYKMLPSILILLFFPLCFLFQQYKPPSKKLYVFILSIFFILSIINLSNKVNSIGEGLSTSKEIYLSVDWIRENTYKESIIITNIGFEGLIAGLGERNQYGGGSTPYTITRFLSPQDNYHQLVKKQKENLKKMICNETLRENLILENNISFFLYSKHPTYLDEKCDNNFNIEISFNNYKKVYSSSDNQIIIYSIE